MGESHLQPRQRARGSSLGGKGRGRGWKGGLGRNVGSVRERSGDNSRHQSIPNDSYRSKTRRDVKGNTGNIVRPPPRCEGKAKEGICPQTTKTGATVEKTEVEENIVKDSKFWKAGSKNPRNRVKSKAKFKHESSLSHPNHESDDVPMTPESKNRLSTTSNDEEESLQSKSVEKECQVSQCIGSKSQASSGDSETYRKAPNNSVLGDDKHGITNVSRATGLKVFTITSSISGYVFTDTDRSHIVRTIPGVVIINTCNNGDALILGIDYQDCKQLSKALSRFTEHHRYCYWSMAAVDTIAQDPFSYFTGWQLIPRVDRNGMYQLIVGLSQDGKARNMETEHRNKLLDCIKDLNISKVVHGPGETILLVTHVLECVAYSDMIRKMFNLERRHTWQPKPLDHSQPQVPHSAHERQFWVKVKCPELNNLTTAHKQYSVFHHLSSAGKVIQLEHKAFGVEDSYLVVYSYLGTSEAPKLGQQFCLLELPPDALPDRYMPTFGVDAWGFYSVAGKFPDNVSYVARNKFAEEMKRLGAVGFRGDKSRDEFSLHFVNSCCLDQIKISPQFVQFRLSILSSLVRKPRIDKKLMKMVPSILKYKELKEREDGHEEKTGVEAVSSKTKDEGKAENKFKTAIQAKETNVGEVKTLKKCSKLDVDHDMMPSNSVVEKGNSGDQKNVCPDVEYCVVSETELLKICQNNVSLHQHAKNLAKLFKAIPELKVSEGATGIAFRFPKTKVVMTMKDVFKDSSLSLEKLKRLNQKVYLQGSKFFKNKYGLVVNKYKTMAQLKKDLSKFNVEIEVRSEVFVLWFSSKILLYHALNDPVIREFAQVIPCVENLHFVLSTSRKPSSNTVEVAHKSDADLAVNDIVEHEPSAKQRFELSEKEIFGFIWQKDQAKTRIRDDQIISRQLSNFIKSVSCTSMGVEEEGLVIRFSTKAEKEAVLAQFSLPSVPQGDQVEPRARKFTLLPFRGLFGLFSVKRVKEEHFTKFGNCKIRNCGIWFSDKLSMINALRDPFIRKSYPTLFIDCRNIFILSSKNINGHDKPVVEDNPKVDSSMGGVTTRSAIARMNASTCISPSGKTLIKQQEDEISSIASVSQVDQVVQCASEPGGQVQKVSDQVPLSNGELLLRALLPTDTYKQNNKILPKTELGQGKFGYNLGKISPSVNEEKVGATEDVEKAFEDECKFLKASIFKEAKGLFKNMMEDKKSKFVISALRDIKLKSVEHFLKDKLGVECKISNEGKEKLKAGGMLVDDENKFEHGVSEDIHNEINVDVENNLEEISNGAKMKTVNSGAESPDCKRERLLKKEKDKRLFQKEALIFPADFETVGHDENDDIKQLDCISKDIKDGQVTLLPSHTDVNSNQHPANLGELTRDVAGLYTLSIPTTEKSNLTIPDLQDDILWFDKPVSIIHVEYFTKQTGIEVKFRHKEMAMAVLQGLLHKYPMMVGDNTNKFNKIVKDSKTGLYTLCFTDTMKKKFKATKEKFSHYSKVRPPVISKGVLEDQVLVGFHEHEEAIEALKENIENNEFPGLHVATVSRG